jgi:hypothetical protein
MLFAALPVISLAFAGAAHASELKPETIAAFDRYVRVSEARMADQTRDNQFLIVDRLPDAQRRETYEKLRGGEIYIEEVHAEEEHHAIHVPSGMIHNWAGVIFIPKATLAEALAVLNDYDHEPSNYKPEVLKAKLIQRNGNESKVFEQLYTKSLVTVVLNGYFDVVETAIGKTRSESASRSTRIAEVVDWGSPEEHEGTETESHGYMWRLNSYWRIEEKDGGVYLQNESISLSRTVPPLLAWLINPLTKSIPRNVLHDMLVDTQAAVERSH